MPSGQRPAADNQARTALLTTPLTRSIFLPGIVVATILILGIVIPMIGRTDRQLVLYCAHDAALAQPVIDRFEADTGIRVDVRFDEEANKSLGLTNLLIAEKDAPRADVFWNNQLLGTARLRREGVLQTYRGSGWKRIPAALRDNDGYWTGFAARCRVYIVNTDRMEATSAVAAQLEQQSLHHVAIAEPLFGTTLSHYCVLADQLGLSELKTWHDDLRQRGIRVVRGNAMVKDMVAEGVCDMGYTDTDDAFAAIDAGAPVAMVPVRVGNQRTICLPNTIAMIAGCRNPDAARQFIDFVLSEETEQLLARAAGHQIPVGPVDESQIPEEMQPLQRWAKDSVPLAGAAVQHDVVREWLSAESTGQ